MSRLHFLTTVHQRFTGVIHFQVDHLCEKPGKLTAVREMSGILLKIREMSGKRVLSGKCCLKLFIVSCIFASTQVFSRSLFCVN